MRAWLLRWHGGILRCEVLLGMFLLPRGRQAKVRYHGYVSKFKASEYVNKLQRIYLSGVHGASANNKWSNTSANNRALTIGVIQQYMIRR